MPDELLPEDEVRTRLATLDDAWSIEDGHLHREVRLASFSEAFACMTRIALAAEKLDHHPDWSNSWNRVVIDIVSHDAGGITARCFALAEAVDQAAGGPAAPRSG